MLLFFTLFPYLSYFSFCALSISYFNSPRNPSLQYVLLIALYLETIFLYASSLKGVKLNNFSLSKVTRFFETGVKSYFGEQLVEFGFPVDAIKRIEDCNVKLVSMNADLSKKYIQEHLADIKKVLDTYEKELLDRALKSIF